MKVYQYQCNLCHNVILKAFDEFGGIALISAGRCGEEYSVLKEDRPEHGQAHLCSRCLKGLKAFFAAKDKGEA